MKQLSNVILLLLVVAVLVTMGCESGIKTDRVRFVKLDRFNSWVDMPGRPPDGQSNRDLVEEVVFTREVESRNSDGSVVIKVTFESVKVTDKRLVQGEQYELTYDSTAEKTVSTEKNEPPLAGVSYQILMAPDTTVKAIMGVDQLRQELGFQEGVVTMASRFLEDKYIRLCNEREFMQSGVQAGGTITRQFPVRHVMNKAQALEKTFRAQKTKTPQGRTGLAVQMTGQAIYVLPSGWPQPPPPPDPYREQIKAMSDMQDPVISGESLYDLKTKQVLHDYNKIKCVLIITEDKISQQLGKEVAQEQKGSGGQMFTEIELEHRFETLLK